MKMTSTRPYLVRAIYEWITDNQLTPYILVNAQAPDMKIPERYVDNGRIILNVGYNAVRQLRLDNERIHFDARFDGQGMHVSIPMQAVLAIYAKENGQGMVLEEKAGPNPPPDNPPDPPSEKNTRPHLTLVK